jgi:two-component system, OmpR family, response regulator
MDATKTILVAEDDPAIASLLLRILGAEWSVTRVADGLEAVARLCEEPLPRLVMLDVMMPGADGFEVAKALRDIPGGARVPIIFITALDRPMDLIKGIQHGAKHYVTKPFQASDLLAKVRKLM